MRNLVKTRLQTQVTDRGRVDRYRLSEGRVQFQAGGTRTWRTLEYPDIQHHLALNTPVGKWLGYLNSLSQTAHFLSCF